MWALSQEEAHTGKFSAWWNIGGQRWNRIRSDGTGNGIFSSHDRIARRDVGTCNVALWVVRSELGNLTPKTGGFEHILPLGKPEDRRMMDINQNS